jgi:hypothetical protein
MPYIGRGLSTGAQYQKLDTISIDNATTFTMQVGGTAVTPAPEHLILAVNGVIQEPNVGFTLSGSTCTLASAIDNDGGSDTIWGMIAGDAAYAAVTALNNATANELVTVGSTTTELDAEANLTFDGTDLTISSSTSEKPVLNLKNTNADNLSAYLYFTKDGSSAADDDVLGQIRFYGENDAGTPESIAYARMYARSVDVSDGTEDGSITFLTYAGGSDTTTMQLLSGKVGIGTTSPTRPLHVSKDVADGWVAEFDNQSTNPIVLTLNTRNASTNNTSNRFLACDDSTATRMAVYTNGSIQNVEGTYGSALSDERLKIDIKDANSQWDDVKNINIVNYKRLVDGEDSKSMLSVIGQQVKDISPHLIGERPPHPSEVIANPIFGTLYEEGDEIPEHKNVGDLKETKEMVLFFKDSIFFWKCAKALQEAMERIEELSAKVEALENA